MTRMKKGFMTLFASLLLAVSVAAPVSAANQRQDGLVNVAVGDIAILNDANVGVAAQVAASICGVKVGPVAVLATQVDRSGETRTVCETTTGPLTLEQNQ